MQSALMAGRFPPLFQAALQWVLQQLPDAAAVGRFLMLLLVVGAQPALSGSARPMPAAAFPLLAQLHGLMNYNEK